MNLINSDNQESKKTYPLARCLSWFFLAASVLLMIYTYYREAIIFQGDNIDIYFKYYLISFAGVLFWGIVLKLGAGVRANIVTIATSLLIGLYLFEGVLTFLDLEKSHNPEAISAAVDLKIEFDQRTRLEVIEDLIAEGVDAVPAIGPRNVLSMDDNLLPLGGLSNKTTVSKNENGYYMVFLSDRYGFNNPDSEWDSTKVEWLLTGDSFAAGRAVRPGEDIAGQIRDITHQSSISLGKGGNGPLMELAALTEFAPAAKPKKVLWMYYEENDLRGDLLRDKRNVLLMQYMEDGFSQNLIQRQKEIDSRLEEYVISAQAQALQNKKLWMRLGRIRSLLNFDVSGLEVDVEDPLFAKILTKAKAEVELWDGRLYFVYLPEYKRYSKKVISHDQFRKKAEVLRVVNGLNIQVIDIHKEVFADHPDPLAFFPFRLNGHYNADGYSEVAKAIVKGVNKYQ